MSKFQMNIELNWSFSTLACFVSGVASTLGQFRKLAAFHSSFNSSSSWFSRFSIAVQHASWNFVKILQLVHFMLLFIQIVSCKSLLSSFSSFQDLSWTSLMWKWWMLQATLLDKTVRLKTFLMRKNWRKIFESWKINYHPFYKSTFDLNLINNWY